MSIFTPKYNKEKEIKKLKSTLRDYIIQYNELTDSYSCGLNLAAHINPNISNLAININKILDDLSVLDPSAPKFRYPTGTQ